MSSFHISVAVGVIQNQNQEILLGQRALNSHQGGKWEFPGGKVDVNEIPRQALTRELREELGIEVQRAEPLIRIHHDYGDKKVVLDVWRVTSYLGEPHGHEGQAVRWVPINELCNYDFPAANQPIVTAIRLPQHYVIIPHQSETQLYQHVSNVLNKGYRLLRLRAQQWEEGEYQRLIPQVSELCAQYNAQLLIDGEPERLKYFSAAGLHLNSKQLFEYQERPIAKNYWLGVSCHNAAELAQAQKINADFAILSPVLPTASHAEAFPLGWPAFSKLVDAVNLPVYALGGMQINSPAIWFGAQGVAGIRLGNNPSSFSSFPLSRE